MGVTLNLYKNKIKRIVRDILVENQLHELFDSPPFQTSFNFGENNDEVYTNFEDFQQNKVKVYFYKDKNQSFLLDFIMNGQSRKDPDVKYSLKEYTSLLATVAKSTSSFLDEYKPNSIRIEGYEEFGKELQGRKINIYQYFLSTMNDNPNYGIQYDKNGSFDLIRKNKEK
jgi:hypothetical protein